MCIRDRNSSAYGVEVERDGYTLYSAVRVVGGEGSSAPVRSGIASSGYTDLFPVDGVWERTSSTVITSKYPIASISGTIAQVCSTGLPAGVPSQVRVGFKGLHDDDANYQALTSYGGNEIEMKDGYTCLLYTSKLHIQKDRQKRRFHATARSATFRNFLVLLPTTAQFPSNFDSTENRRFLNV